jgi:phosphate starvation-inducible PhoH-like protein
MATNSGKRARRLSKESTPTITSTFKEVKALNYIQGEYLEAIKNNTVIFGVGPAGTGKTYVATAYAAQQLFYKKIDKIILTRPNVETGRGLGFLPGELEEKYAPYLQPFDDIFRRTLGNGHYEYELKSKNIDPKPLGFMRGSTFDNCIVLADEMQNATREEMKMLLTRIGKNCKMIFSGDTEQCDITDSGFSDAIRRLEGIEDIEVTRFMDNDIVRSQMCKKIIMAYRNN